MSWGSRTFVTEFNPQGERTFLLGFGGTILSSTKAKPGTGFNAVPFPSIAKGAPADLILVDLGAPRLIDADQLLSKSKNSAFDGRRLQGQVKMTLVDGRTVFEG